MASPVTRRELLVKSASIGALMSLGWLKVAASRCSKMGTHACFTRGLCGRTYRSYSR
jgi:hypothetical protein